jgi:hypothetical protein
MQTTKGMLIYDTNCLYFTEAIIDAAKTRLILFTHETGNLVLMANVKQQPQKVFFTTNALYLDHFINDRICLQLFFDAMAPSLVTVSEGEKFKICKQSDVQLLEGSKIFSEIKYTGNGYVFPMRKIIARQLK